MKPKTKQQKEIVKLSKKLQELTPEQSTWAYNKLFPNIAEPYRSSILCMECGHSWKGNALSASLLGTTCPNCNRKLKYSSSKSNTHSSASAYFAQITVVEKYQVVRIFEYRKLFHRTHPSSSFFQEVVNVWISETGRYDIMSKVSIYSPYFYQWSANDSEMEIRDRNGINSYHKLRIIPDVILPGRKVLPIVKRNGYTGYFYNTAPQMFFLMLIQNSFFETLVKAKQRELIANFERYSAKIEKYWRSIRICLRNNYIIDDASIYFDYLELLEYFEKDLRNPKYVCPGNLMGEHDRLVKKREKVEEQREFERQLASIVEKDNIYVEKKGRFLDLEISNGPICIRPLQSVADFYAEARALHHCVYASGYYERDNSLILSARIDDKPVETIEVSLKPLEIVQCRGTNNMPSEYHDDIVNLVKSGIPKIARKLNERVVV